MILLLAAALQTANPTDGEKLGNWTFDVSKDPMTDATETSIHARNEEVRIDYGCGIKGDAPSLVMIRTGKFLGAGYPGHRQYVDALLRFGENPPVKLLLVANNETASAIFKYQVSPLVTGMQGANRLRGRIFNYRGEPVDFDIDIAGFAQAQRYVDPTCSK